MGVIWRVVSKRNPEASRKGEPRAAQSRSRLRALPDRLHDTLELLSEAFFILDHRWRFAYLNRAAEGLLARSREELIDCNIWEEFPEAVGTESDVEYHRALSEQITVRFEQHYPPLGKWFEAEAHPVPDGLAVYFRDVTERHLRTQQLRRQAALLDAANDAIFVMDQDYRIQYWNRGAETIYGHRAEAVIGRLALEVLDCDAPAFAQAIVRMQTEGEFNGELIHGASLTDPIVSQCRWSLVVNESQEAPAILAIHSDITQKKNLEAQFLRVQRMESIGALAGGIAHDLNNSLAPILLAASLMSSDDLSVEQLESLATIEACTRRGAAMVRQLLAFARGSGDQRSRVELPPIGGELQKIIRDTFPKDVQFELSTSPFLWDVEADATQIHQVLTNLCVNARDAMPSGGRLTVTMTCVELDARYVKMNLEAKVGPYVVIAVEDTGIGMSQELLERIYDPFFTTKEVGKGTGLGLSTSHAIVRNHGGFIRVTSEVGRGTKFEVYLPALLKEGPPIAVAPPEASLPRGQGELILVVDDEESICQLAVRTLKKYGYNVLTAASGPEAIALFSSRLGEVALVLMDMMMPVMDGPATAATLRAMDPKLKIVGATGLGTDANLAKANQAGMKHLIAKPYAADVLLQKIHQVLREG